MIRCFSIVVATLLYVYGCTSSVNTPPAFDSDRAYGYLVKQVEFGPRVPGSDAWRNCRANFNEFFNGIGLDVDSQVFSFHDPYSGRDLPLVNVIVRYRGGQPNDLPIVLMAHWDSRPRADYATNPDLVDQPIDGANDGASGVAVLMELAQMVTEQKAPSNVDFVLVDGEDWGKSGDVDYYLLGSKHFAVAGDGIRGKYRFGIVVDMVGDRDQRILREGFSQRFEAPLNDMVWKAARELGVTTFADSVSQDILDDHLSLATAGVPAIDVIDFDYRYWHTELDTPDKCSPESLGNVGRVLAHIIYNPSLWPKN